MSDTTEITSPSEPKVEFARPAAKPFNGSKKMPAAALRKAEGTPPAPQREIPATLDTTGPEWTVRVQDSPEYQAWARTDSTAVHLSETDVEAPSEGTAATN